VEPTDGFPSKEDLEKSIEDEMKMVGTYWGKSKSLRAEPRRRGIVQAL